LLEVVAKDEKNVTSRLEYSLNCRKLTSDGWFIILFLDAGFY
jgi:hypothetical protein